MAAPLADPVLPGHGTGGRSGGGRGSGGGGGSGAAGAGRSGGGADLLTRIRRICGGLPEVTERPSHGAPTWFVRDKKTFVTLWEHGHHADEFPHLWCAAPPGAQEELVAAAPERFFRPPYVGGRGWVGVRLDGEVDWDEVAELCQDAYRTIAPATLVAALDAGTGGSVGPGR